MNARYRLYLLMTGISFASSDLLPFLLPDLSP